MAKTTYLEEQFDHFDNITGEIYSQSKYKRIAHKTEVTDQFIKVTKYLNVIFAYNNIPLSMVPISLLFAQRMQFKSNILYLLKEDKEEIAQMLNCSLQRVNTLILDAKKYDIIRPLARGKYEVNSFLFSTGDAIETKKLQAHFDFDDNSYSAAAEQKNLITGAIVKKAVKDYQEDTNQVKGQMSLEDLGDADEQ